jgi:soluble lytic murein transglycosylase-like protein
MGLLGLSLIVNLVGWGGHVGAAPTAAPIITVSAAKSPLAQADKAADKPAKNKPTIANPGKPAKNTPSSTKTVTYKQTTEEICRTIEQAATENQLPVNFFVRVIWQESRFNPRLVGRKGAIGIAQFMRETADFRGLADPFDPISSIENAARYLGDLRKMFGNLGLAAAGYNAGPGRVREWLDRKGALPKETRDTSPSPGLDRR